MYNSDFTVMKVFVHKNKQVAFEIRNAVGGGLILDIGSMVTAVQSGHSFTNATVSANGSVRVDKNVVRETVNPATFPFPNILN